MTGCFVPGALLALLATLLVGIVVEVDRDATALRPRPSRPGARHLRALILFFNELVRLIWGPAGTTMPLPAVLNRRRVLPGVYYPLYRFAIIVARCGRAPAVLLVMRTRIGMLIRAGASNRRWSARSASTSSCSTRWCSGWARCSPGFAGLMPAPITSVQIGMGEDILILAFVVIVIGGIGSIRGAFVAAIIVGLIDTIGRAFLPDLVRHFLSSAPARAPGRRSRRC